MLRSVAIDTSARDIGLSTACSAAAFKMSLFQFGFSHVHSITLTSVPAHMPTQEESGLGAREYVSSLKKVAEHANPANKGRRQLRDSYTCYSVKDKAATGKYALEKGNVNASWYFKERFPDLKESIVTSSGVTRDS